MVNIRVFCQPKSHSRARMEHRPQDMAFFCAICGVLITEEAAYRAVPDPYRALLKNDFGLAFASLADVGAIDVIVTGQFRPFNIEYPREKDVE